MHGWIISHGGHRDTIMTPTRFRLIFSIALSLGAVCSLLVMFGSTPRDIGGLFLLRSSHLLRNSLRKPVNLSACLDTKFMPNGRMPYILLVSFPGSGNTWLRYLMEKVTGIYTGSILNDRTLHNGGFLGQLLPPKSGRVTVVKTHDPSSVHDDDVKGIILLIRNPYNAFISDYNRRLAKGNHTGFAPPAEFKTKQWDEFVCQSAVQWKELVSECLNTKSKLLILYYEDLFDSLPREMTRLVQFLGLPLDDERLRCTIHNTEGNFHRAQRTLPFDPFTKKMKTDINRIIRTVRAIMTEHKQLPVKSYEKELC